MKLIELLTEMLILEVGEGVEPYEYKITSSGSDHYEAIFNVISREGKVLDEIKISLEIGEVNNILIKLLCGEIKYLHISFESKKTRHMKTSTPINKTYIEYRDEEERRQPFKIMSTVVSFVKKVLLSYEPSVQIISFSSDGQTGKEKQQKEKLYRAYFNKELSKGEFDFVESSGKIKIFYDDSQVIKRSTNDCISHYLNEDGTYNLRYVDLSGADLTGAILIDADLTRADLSSANLSGANLTSADLRGANLSGLNLSDANLSFAYLRDANLTGADLSGANLYSANLSGANLMKAYLMGAKLMGADLSGADLSGAKLMGADLSGADLSDANLSGADLSGADLSDANLRGADLRDANLKGADLRDANLTGANLSGTNLNHAILIGANLTGVKYDSNTKWPEGFNPS